jgi:hypothetical protein
MSNLILSPDNSTSTLKSPPPPKNYETLKAEKMEALKPVAQVVVDDLIQTGKIQKSEATPQVTPTVERTPENDGEFACCQNETRPCKHWVWDVNTGEGYVNTLSGRSRDAE